MKVVIASLLLVVCGVASANSGCTGAADCKACKTCKSCKHCHKEGGTCGAMFLGTSRMKSPREPKAPVIRWPKYREPKPFKLPKPPKYHVPRNHPWGQ